MGDLEIVRKQSPIPETETGNIVLLDAIREQLQNDPNVYFAGELTNPKDDWGRLDQHDLFVAPVNPHFDPEELTAFAEALLEGFRMTSSRKARMHQNGDMQLAYAFVDQHIGDRETKTSTTTNIVLGSFKGQTEETVEEEVENEKLVQRTKVKVFTDPVFAQTLFDYCSSLVRGELDEKQSTNVLEVYATHILPAGNLTELKKHYENPENKLPQPSKKKK